MIDHFGINSADFERATKFYDAVLGVLDYEREHQNRLEVMQKLRYMRGAQPLPGYDEMAAMTRSVLAAS